MEVQFLTQAPYKCCGNQEMTITDADGQPLGKIWEPCWMCNKTLNVLRPDGTVEYEMRQPGCNDGGCCASLHCYAYSCYYDGAC